MLLSQKIRFGRHTAVRKLIPVGSPVPQRSQTMIDDKRRELRATHVKHLKEVFVGNIRAHGKQSGSIIIEARHVVIVADS